jgi:ketosteroid isomerase-like protein
MTRAAIKHAEARLRDAMLASDVVTLDDLLDDALLFCGPNGTLVRKEDDLDAHRSGAQRLTRLDPRDLVVELHGEDVGVVSALVEVGGFIGDQPFGGTFRYTRTWKRGADGAWRVVAGAVVALPGVN